MTKGLQLNWLKFNDTKKVKKIDNGTYVTQFQEERFLNFKADKKYEMMPGQRSSFAGCLNVW